MSPKWESNPHSNPYQGFVLPLNYSGTPELYLIIPISLQDGRQKAV